MGEGSDTRYAIIHTDLGNNLCFYCVYDYQDEPAPECCLSKTAFISGGSAFVARSTAPWPMATAVDICITGNASPVIKACQSMILNINLLHI